MGIFHGTLDFLLITRHGRNFGRFDRILGAHVLEFIDHNDVAVQLCCRFELQLWELGVGTIHATCRTWKSCQVYRSNKQSSVRIVLYVLYTIEKVEIAACTLISNRWVFKYICYKKVKKKNSMAGTVTIIFYLLFYTKQCVLFWPVGIKPVLKVTATLYGYIYIRSGKNLFCMYILKVLSLFWNTSTAVLHIYCPVLQNTERTLYSNFAFPMSPMKALLCTYWALHACNKRNQRSNYQPIGHVHDEWMGQRLINSNERR